MIYKRIDHREKKIATEESLVPLEFWEEVPDEDLWEDGEINNQKELMDKIEHHLLITGKWKLMRRKNNE